MTVRELIEELSKFPSNSEVYIEDDEYTNLIPRLIFFSNRVRIVGVI